MSEALQNERNVNARSYSDYLQRMFADRKDAREIELKRDIAGQNYDLGLKKLENNLEIAQLNNEAKKEIAKANNEARKYISAHKSSGSGSRGSSNKYNTIVVNDNPYRLTKEEADIVLGYITQYLEKALYQDPNVFDAAGNFSQKRYEEQKLELYKRLKGNTETLLGEFAKKHPQIVENAILYLLSSGQRGGIETDDEEIQIETFE